MTGLEALNKIQHDFGQLKGQELVNCYETINKELKALEIIKEKCVGNDNLRLVKEAIGIDNSLINEALKYKHYLMGAKLGIDNIVNTKLEEKDLLTEEEFNTLKEGLE